MTVPHRAVSTGAAARAGASSADLAAAGAGAGASAGDLHTMSLSRSVGELDRGIPTNLRVTETGRVRAKSVSKSVSRDRDQA